MKKAPYYLICVLLLLTQLSCRQEPKRMPDTQPDVYGYITHIKYTAKNGSKSSAVVAVKSLEDVVSTYKDASVRIDEHTLMENEVGEKLDIGQLREGHQIQAWFEGEVQEKAPVLGYAKAVRISP
ncbi:hypothetical protein [Pontibacter chinhatensis]|nr:hypothetical protein [Pontibacter chinhatensis]